MEKEDDLDGQARVFEGPMQLQQRDLKHIGLQHLYHCVLNLPFLPLSKWAFVVEAAPPAPERCDVALSHGRRVKQFRNAVEMP